MAGGTAQRSALTGLGERLTDIYDRLFQAFGPQHWWPGDGAFEIAIGAILTQSTNWANVAKAIANLKQAGVLTPQALAAVSDERLAQLVRPSGYYHAKTRKVRAFMNLVGEYDGDLDRLLALDMPALRPILLATHGIGPETADAIILYAAGQPIFVIDAYTRRIVSRLGLCPPAGRYEDLQTVFMANLPHDAALFNEYHALLVRLGKTICTKSEPRCGECPLSSGCPTARP
jgi:endonuclease-3 related protein